MLRQSLLLVAVITLAALAPSAEAQSKSRKKDAPRVLKAGDEVRLFVPLAVVTRGDVQTASEYPNAAKAGVVGPDFLVIAVAQAPIRGADRYRDQIDSQTRDDLNAAARVGDRTAVDRMLAEGRAAKVPVDTKLLVTYRTPGTPDCRARVVDGPDAGKIVEVPVRNVR
jgi:hypothetical protein